MFVMQQEEGIGVSYPTTSVSGRLSLDPTQCFTSFIYMLVIQSGKLGGRIFSKLDHLEQSIGNYIIVLLLVSALL